MRAFCQAPNGACIYCKEIDCRKIASAPAAREIPGRRMRSWRDSRAQALFASNITRSALSNFILQKFWLHDGSFERRQTSRGHGGEATQRDRTDGLRKCVGRAVGEFLHAEDRLVLTLGNRPGRLDRQGLQAQAQWAMMFSQRPDHGVRCGFQFRKISFCSLIPVVRPERQRRQSVLVE